jgi:methanogenic corrinoid protein MtbC1
VVLRAVVVLKEETRYMEQDTANAEYLSITLQDVLGDILRQGAQQMLVAAIENEVTEYVGLHAHLRKVQKQVGYKLKTSLEKALKIIIDHFKKGLAIS